MYRHGFDPASLAGDGYRDWHRAFVLLRHASSETPFKAAVLDWANEGVSLDSHLLAALNDNLANLMYGLGNRKGPRPKPIDLTGEAKKRDTLDFSERLDLGDGYDPEDMKRMLGIKDI